MGKRRSAPPPPPAKTKADIRQEKEDAKLDAQIEAREKARTRKKKVRFSLISGDERGITDTLGG
jgi:hypothetical protein